MRLRVTRCLLLTALAVTIFQTPPIASADVVNGDFSTASMGAEPFDAWTTFTLSDAPTDGGGLARFNTIASVDPIIQLEQNFTVPANTLTLSFEIVFSTLTGGQLDPFGAFDSFQATLLDAQSNPINPIDAVVLPGFYLLDASGFEDTPASGVSVENLPGGLKRVTLDIASLSTQQVTIDFQLLGDDDQFATTVALDNVIISRDTNVVPEPSCGLAIAIACSLALTSRRRRTTAA